MKERGLTPTKRKKHIEDHHDDCGNDLTGLGPVQDSDDDDHRNVTEINDTIRRHIEASQSNCSTRPALKHEHTRRSHLASFSESLSALFRGANFKLIRSDRPNPKDKQNKVDRHRHKCKHLAAKKTSVCRPLEFKTRTGNHLRLLRQPARAAAMKSQQAQSLSPRD